MIVLKAPIVAFVYTFQPPLKELSRSGALPLHSEATVDDKAPWELPTLSLKNKRRDSLHPLWLLSVCLSHSLSLFSLFFPTPCFCVRSSPWKQISCPCCSPRTHNAVWPVLSNCYKDKPWEPQATADWKSLLNFLWSVPEAECRTLTASGLHSGALL